MSSLLRSRGRAAASLLVASLALSAPAFGDNPIVQHVYTADPAPLVHGDTVYLYTSHDEDVTVGSFFTMNDWRLFSSKDMVNWTDHGSPLGYRSFAWAKGKAWAPHPVERNGKFYLYVPVSDAIGVAVADAPTGPFVDAIGKPLVSNYQYIDPTVFVDADGQAYLYFGNPKLWYVKLNADMISYSGQIQEVSMSAASFGSRSGDATRPTSYEEGPWFYARDGLYYLVFASGPLPEKISYSTSSSPTGPWTYRGVIMDNQSGHAFTNHSGVVDFKGQSYFFYHTQELQGGGGYKRSVALERFSYGTGGTFPSIKKTASGVTESAAPLDPYQRVEAETIAWAPAIEVEDCSEGGRDVSSIENGDSIKVRSVDFGSGAVSFLARVAAAGEGGSLELHLDSATGSLLGSCKVVGTGGAQKWQSVECDVTSVAGIHDLFLVFKGGGGSLFNVNYWQFTAKEPAGGSAGTAGATAGGAGGSSGAGGTLGGASGASTGGAGSGGSASGGSLAGGAGVAGRSAAPGGGAPATAGSTASGGGPPPAADDEAGEPGCACAFSSGAGARVRWGLLLGGLAAAAARRRRRHAEP